MTKPPTAEHPGNQPAPATQRRSGKGRPAKAGAGRARADTAPAPGKGGAPPARNESAELLGRLTAREAQAFAHLAAGRDLAETAAALGVTPTTARSYRHRALRKLGTRTQDEIAALAALLPAPEPAPGGRPEPAGAKPRRGAAAGSGAPAAAPGDRAGRGRRTADGRGGGTDRTDATAAPDRQEAAHRPEADTTGANRPRGVRAGRSADNGAAPPRTAGAGGETATGRDDDHRTTTGPAAPDRHPAQADADRTAAAQPAGDGAGRRGPTAAHTRPTTPGHGDDRTATGPAAPDRHTTGDGTGERRPAAGFEEVYETAHTRLAQQVFLLTACKYRAVHCVGRAFGEARRRWPEAVAGGEPESWVRARAFELALSPWHRGGPRRTHTWRLPHRRIKVRPADEAQAVLPDHDRLTDRDRALLKALRRLSRPQRRALVLHDGLGMPAAAVAVEVESTLAAAEGRVWAARTALAHWVPELVGTDPAADGFADRLCALMHRAAVRGVPQPYRPPVPLLRARHGLVNAGRTGAAALLTAAVGGAVVATLAGGGPGALFRPPGPPPPSLCAPFPTSAADPDAPLPLLADGPPSGIQSLWCSPTPGLEPVVVDPPPPREDGPYRPPTGGRAAEALPPPGAVAAEPPPGCAPAWALHPCAPGR
ncbi:sigma factor-like helix-turn-helix DNA-binding protein [Kitasatospora sp. NPDC056184]|uniref:sigma factor-like helix-turn-helix DNA-binding protein n=1 Tax=Kitasatospora sp. NPDC056184 TaxID=3345738 RepID=UPI0035DBECF7